ncbi:MAG: RtcB family protein [Promethearchaeota archaeon]
MLEYRGKYNKAHVMIDEIDEVTVKQIYQFLNHPAFANTYIAIMPDCHAGKGAISAHKGERILIPFNMRDGIAVCKGKGSSKYNFSAPHGAGRVLSRTKAKETLSMDEFEASMQGIYTTSVHKSTLDESPMVYKDKNLIIKNIQETADVEFFMKPVYNFKAS